MRKKIFTFLLALAASVGLSWATDPIVIVTNTSQSSYTQGNITISCSRPGDNEGFYLDKDDNETATITNSGSSTISQIELGIGWFPDDRSYVRANGAEPTSSDPYSITFSNVNSNNVTLTITNNKIQIRDVTITLADEGGSTPSGLQVTELQVPGSWADNPTMLSTSDMPGFVAITEAEATAWDAAPAGDVVLIFAFEGDGATSLSFKNGVYQAAQAHNITYEDLYGWSVLGRQIFYTGGGSTPSVDPTPTPSATGGIFANCYDCWRNPPYPTISGQCRLYNFGNPYVGNNNPSGPWKLEFVENYNSSSTEYESYIVNEDVANQYGKNPEEMEVYRLYQWQNGAYQPVAYGVLYAYANESNPAEHAAFFEAGGHYGCYFTDNTHSYGDNVYVTFNEDASTGFADLHGGSTPTPDPEPTPSGDGDKLAGAFSVSGTKVVYFSKGNLQATTNDLGATWTWGFAENQWDYVGNNAANNAINGGGTVSANGPVDLFAWSSTANNYFGINNSINEADYSGDFKDWGAKMGSDWSTLTINEWQYLLQERNPGSSSANHTNYPRYTNAQILTDGTAPQKDIKGIILFPDDFNDGGESIDGVTWGSINPSFFSSYPTTCTTAGWATLESMGCVFLPSAGSRQNFGEEFANLDVNQMGNYWSSTLYSGEPEDPQSIVVGGSTLGIGTSPRYFGMSVRLVSDIAPSPAPAPAGLQVTELQIPASWQNDPTLVTISDLPGFVAVSLEEAGAWDAVPAGDVVLIYAGTNEGVTATYFHNGAWGDPVPFGGFSRADIFEWASGSKIFYTSGGSTPTPTPTPSGDANIFNYSYECDRSQYYPTKDNACNVYNFENEAAGQWKVEFLENYDRNNTAYANAEDLWYVLGNYYNSVPGYWEEEAFWAFVDEHPVPVFTLSQWDGSEYQFVSYGLVLAYANPSNAVEHAAVFRANGSFRYLTDNTHGVYDDFNITFDSDLTDGLSDLVPAPVVPTDQELADVVIGLINAIPNPVAYNDDCKNAIDAARAAYDALNAAQKDLVENYGDLLDAETAYAQSIPHPNGECGAQGDNLLWDFNPSTGVLTITGSGAMADWHDDTQRPWYSYYGQITSVVLPEGLTTIGEKAFKACDIVSINTNNVLPSTLTTIKQEGFCGINVTNITIPASVVLIEQDAFYLSGTITDVYCYADPNNLTWGDYWCDDFISSPKKTTQCHVKSCYLDVFNSKWNTGNSSTDINVTYVGDLPGDCTPAVDPAVQNVIDLINAIPNPVAYNDECKNAIDAARAAYDALNADQKALVSNYSTLTDAEDAYAALIPVVTNYSISLDGITENADKVTLNNASAAEGETITLTPAAGYQITAFTASYASAYSVRVTADPNVNVYDATPYVGALPKEFTENVTPGQNGATFHSIEGDDPFTPVPASVLEYVGMNAAKDQMTIRVNDAFSGIIRVNYTYNVENCEWDEYEQQEICMGGTALASVRVVCEAAGGVAPASKDDVTGAYSFTMPAGNVTITATVEAIPAPANSCGDGLTWELNDGVLTISYDGVGTGVMDDWGGYNEAPWSSEKLQITSVVLPEGITTIGSAAFRGCTNLASVNMAENFPASLTTIKTEAFYNSALTSVTIPANVVSIYSNVFYGCQSIANVYCYANPNDLVWMDGYCDDFKSGNKITQCHVKNCYLSLYNTKWNTGYELTDVNVTFVGDLPGDCGSSTFIDADFAINFMNDPYIVVGGGDLPEGVLVEGIPNKDINHGYYNVIITIPAKAGTYKVTLGTCGFGLGNGTIQNENGSTTYASFNQHLADNDLCYHQDPTNNIVTAIFTLPEDQNIIVDCGEYTPYFSIEASSAPAPSYIDADFAIDFRHNPYEVVGGGSLPTGVEVSGTPNGDISHGYTGAIITIPVTAGNYKVTMGTCTYSNHDGFVKTEDGSHTYATLATNNGTCYHQNTATNVVSEIFNVPTDQVIKVHGAQYTPYFAIEKMAAVPAFTDFEINFRTEPYSMISGAKPEGTVIAGSFHDGDHGYQNVEVTVPMEAGTYRLTMGACQFGNGAGNVMSAANAELASFNQNLGENKCYHQNPSANIVSVTFTVDIDQNITINGGAYVPYMKLEKISAYHVVFALGDAEGSAPAAVNVTIGEDLTMPVNKTIYKDGYTLTGWSDGVNTYAIGEPFTPTSDAVLTPVFSANAVAITDATEEVSVRWYFGKSNEAPDFAWQNNSGFLVAQAIIGGNPIDVRLDINATAGKFSNEGRDDKWAQVNATTILSFPGKEDAVVAVETYNNNPEHYAINATAGTLTCNTNDYYSYLEIVYPAPTAVVIGDPNNASEVETFLETYDGQTIDELIIDRPVYNNMYNTLCLPFDMNATQIAASSLNGVEIREFTGASVEGTTLNLSVGDPVNAVVAGRPYFVKYSAASQLEDLHFEDVTINNALLDNMAVTFDGVTFKGTFTPFVMPNGLNFQGGYLFLGQNNQLFWPNTPNPLKPFRAYFYVNVEASTPGNAPKYRGMPARIVEGKNVATGVENAQSANQSTKVIVNGQLIIIKNDVRYNAQGQIVK